MRAAWYGAPGTWLVLRWDFVDTDMQGRGFEWSSGEDLGTGVHLDRWCREAANSLSPEAHDATSDVDFLALLDPESPRSSDQLPTAHVR